MSGSRKPGEAGNEEAMRQANQLDVELSRTLDEVDAALSQTKRMESDAAKPQDKQDYYITMAEYDTLTPTGIGGFFRSFTSLGVSADDQKEINFNKAQLHGCETDQQRYTKALKQRDEIYNKILAKEKVPGALKQYADNLDNLIQHANTRALTSQYQARNKK